MGMMHDLGFHARPRDDWSTAWVLMWGISTPTLLVLAFTFPVTWTFWWLWLGAAAVLFGLPEYLAVRRSKDNLPPLTQTIRHFVPNWVAFPLIYGFLGAVGGRWLGAGYPRFWGVGVMFGLLGWLADHFAVTYARPDPHPHRLGMGEEGLGPEPPPRLQPPVIEQPRPF